MWNLGYVGLGDNKKLEYVQRRWIKEVDGLCEKLFETRLYAAAVLD